LILKVNSNDKKTTKRLKDSVIVVIMQTVALAIVVTGRYVLQQVTEDVKKF
jgi:hypothetical protein